MNAQKLNDLIPSQLPAYTDFLYGDVYSNFDRCIALDKPKSVQRRSLYQYDKLVKALLREIKQNQHVLQMGCVFGNEMAEVARRVGAYGRFDIIDINHFQVDCAKEKYGNAFAYMDMKITCADAAVYQAPEAYDVVVCFMLLQELPPLTQGKVINNALASVKENGRVVFIDYHNPAFLHPLRWPVKMYNRLHHPFVEKLWERDIDTYAHNRTDFQWRKATYFGHMFQKTVAIRKSNSLELLTPQPVEEPEYFFAPQGAGA